MAKLEAGLALLNDLKWDADNGYGYFPCDKYTSVSPYDREYFEKYVGYAHTPAGEKIRKFRLELANKYAADDLVVDIGVGSGDFVQSRLDAKRPCGGYDVNPVAIDWLKSKNVYVDPYGRTAHTLTFWDSLEHIPDPKQVVVMANKFVITTIPIFDDYKHVVNSKHFRPTEHYHYFTHQGLVSYMWNIGFRVAEYTDAEQELGREDVRTFVFRRK